MGFSPEARKHAAIARKIKGRLGQQAYENYKRTGVVPAGLDDAKLKGSSRSNAKTGGGPPVLAKGSLARRAETPDDLAAQKKGMEPKPIDLTGKSYLQADVRPDTPPSSSRTGGPDPFLQHLRQGDIVRDRINQRIRIQRVNPGGLRIHDVKNGARDLTWLELDKLGLQPEHHNEKGPAAQRIGELRDEAESLGIDTSKLFTKRDLEIAIGKKKVSEEGALAQVDPQLASDAKEMQDFSADQPWRSQALFTNFWNNDDWVAEEKLDGVRLKLHFTPEGVRADSRRRDTATRRFSEKSANFAHMLALDIPELHGTVIDAEGMIPATSGILPSGVRFHGSLSVSTAATNAGPPVARAIQDKFGQMKFWVFDVLRYNGKDVTAFPAAVRRKMLEKIVEIIHAKVPGTKEYVIPTKFVRGKDKLPFYEDIINKGGEGIIFKKMSAPYQQGKRSKSWMKLKVFQETDAYVSGYIPGKAGNEGLVGALELAVKIDGKEIPIAAVSQLTQEQRQAMTAPDGSLRPEFYGKVITFRGQELTKKGRFRHAVFVTFRDDKVKSDIDGYEVREGLKRLKII